MLHDGNSSIVKWWVLNDMTIFSSDSAMIQFYHLIIKFSNRFSRRDVVMARSDSWWHTHRLSSDAGFTWQDTQHPRSQSLWPSQPFKIRMSSEDDIRAAVRSTEPEASPECSFRVSLHFSPALAAVRRSVPDSGWPTVTMGQIQISRHRDGGQTSWYSYDDDA